MYKRNRKSWIKHIDFTLVDILCMQLAFIMAYIIRFGWNWPYAEDAYQKIGFLIILIEICVVFFTEAYTGVLRRGYLREFNAVLKNNIVIFAVLLAYLYLTKQSSIYSRKVQVTFLILSIVYVYIGRTILKWAVLKRMDNQNSTPVMLIVGMEENIESCIRDFKREAFLDFIISGAVVMDKDCKGEEILGVPIVANAETVYTYVADNVIDEVFINGSDQKTCENLADVFLQMGVTVHINLIRISKMMPNRLVERCGRFMVLTTSMKIATPKQLFLKRALDLVGAVIGLILTGIAFIIFAPMIKIQSPGPIFFKQVRVGKNGRKFNMYKFRTMVPNAEALKEGLEAENEMDGLMFKMENDPRIFGIGHFMRRFSIDELPQFWNVLRGQMSLVGTRPPTVEEYAQYDLHHRARLGSKPGITGLWQISGRSTITDFEEIVALDTQYIAEWTPGLDIKIIFKTLQVVMMGEGSY